VKTLGYIIAGLGTLLALFGFAMSGTVPSSEGAFNNIGLLSDKANLITAGGAAAISGLMMALIATMEEVVAVLKAPPTAIPFEPKLAPPSEIVDALDDGVVQDGEGFSVAGKYFERLEDATRYAKKSADGSKI
jgi:hypothetical protein